MLVKPFGLVSACGLAVALALAVISARAAGPKAAFPEAALDDRPAGSSGQESKVDAVSGAESVSVVLGGGCFWGVQAVFQRVKGVLSATSGYSGGSAASARYDSVSTGSTGHAESVKVVYDPAQITYGQLLRVFFSVAHDPTELNRQGPDRGTQYRSVIFYSGERQRQIASAYIEQLNSAKVLSRGIVTLVVPLQAFYAAEAYHQNYADHNPFDPYIMINDRPKVENLRRLYPGLYAEHR